MIFDRLKKWREAKGLDIIAYNKITQAGNIAEELSELLIASDIEKQMDAFADLIIYSINAVEMAGYNAESLLGEVIKEIECREGVIIDGKFYKENAETYKAKIKECKRCQQ
tara:strand:+ start:2988 stop:3320 length:333 start_codon:yes stop_codon:yes gene_type:complete